MRDSLHALQEALRDGPNPLCIDLYDRSDEGQLRSSNGVYMRRLPREDVVAMAQLVKELAGLKPWKARPNRYVPPSERAIHGQLLSAARRGDCGRPSARGSTARLPSPFTAWGGAGANKVTNKQSSEGQVPEHDAPPKRPFFPPPESASNKALKLARSGVIRVNLDECRQEKAFSRPRERKVGGRPRRCDPGQCRPDGRSGRSALRSGVGARAPEDAG